MHIGPRLRYEYLLQGQFLAYSYAPNENRIWRIVLANLKGTFERGWEIRQTAATAAPDVEKAERIHI